MQSWPQGVFPSYGPRREEVEGSWRKKKAGTPLNHIVFLWRSEVVGQCPNQFLTCQGGMSQGVAAMFAKPTRATPGRLTPMLPKRVLNSMGMNCCAIWHNRPGVSGGVNGLHTIDLGVAAATWDDLGLAYACVCVCVCTFDLFLV